MKVSINDLRVLSDCLLARIEAKGIETVELPVDYYWQIIHDQQYDAYNTPDEFTLGQLSDDWKELGKILDGEHEPIEYALVWLAKILEAVGETQSVN